MRTLEVGVDGVAIIDWIAGVVGHSNLEHAVRISGSKEIAISLRPDADVLTGQRREAGRCCPQR